MQAFWQLMAFWAKTMAAGVTAFWLGARILGTPASLLQKLGLGAAAQVIGFSLIFLWQVYLYPRHFSPLRRLPRVSSGYDARLVLEGPRGKTPLKWVQAMPDAGLILSEGKYGQQVLYPVSPRALRDVLSTNAYDFEKPLGLRAFLSRVLGHGLIASEGIAHKTGRRSLLPAFNIKHLRALYPVMWSKAGLFLDVLEGEAQRAGSIDVTSWASRFSLDVIGRAALSREFDALRSDDLHPIARAFSVLFEPEPRMVVLMLLSIVFPPWLTARLPLRANHDIHENADYIQRQSREILEAQRAQKATADDQQRTVLGLVLQNSNLTTRQAVDEISTIIGAGHETSAASITWATHLLTLPENAHYQHKLRDEVRAYFAPNLLTQQTEAVPMGHIPPLETLPYLHGCCEETLRLFPPVPATLRESIRTTAIDGTTVPKGTLTVMMPYVINRNPRYWGADADAFRPERWMGQLPDGSLRINNHGGAESNLCNVTFLSGPRACIGRDFARAELKVALAALFGRFEISRLEGDDGRVRVKGAVTTKPQGGLRVRLSRIEGW